MTITVTNELDFYDLMNQCWSGAVDTLKTIEENNMENALMALINECFCDVAPTLTQINDLLWFDDEWIFETLGISEEEEEEE